MLQALCDASYDSILLTESSTGNIVYTNAAFRTLTGYAPDAVRGRSPRLPAASLSPSTAQTSHIFP